MGSRSISFRMLGTFLRGGRGKTRGIRLALVVSVLLGVFWLLGSGSSDVDTVLDSRQVAELSSWLDGFAGIKLDTENPKAVREVMALTLIRFTHRRYRKSSLLAMSNSDLLLVATSVKQLGSAEEHAVAGWANVPVALPGKKLSAYPRQLWLEGPRLWPRWSGGAVPGRHRGATRLALVVPVHDGDIKRFGRMLKNWGRLEGNAETAVVLSYSGNISSPAGQELVRAFELHWRRWVDMDGTAPPVYQLSLHQPRLGHYDGAALSFFQTCEALKDRFSAIALLETDVTPVKRGWLGRLSEEAANPECGWWQKGSVVLCDAWGLGDFARRRDFHMNGNGLYATGCPGFIDYLRRVQRFYPPRAIYKDVGTHCFVIGGCEPGSDTDYNYDAGYDHALYEYRVQPENYMYVRPLLSKFVYSNVYANLCEESPDDHVVSDDTVLIHTKFTFMSPPEQLVARVWGKILHRQPDVEEQKQRYPLLDSGELVESDLVAEACLSSVLWWQWSGSARVAAKKPRHRLCRNVQPTPWTDRLPGKVYLWATDFHSAPVACNSKIYQAAGAVVHSEVDYGNCVYSGTCKDRLKVLGWDDNLGFALKSKRYSDPAALKKAFYNQYSGDDEFKRVDGFICSHPVANCELYLQFGKPVVLFATTRLEFGRHDKFIDWRLPDWNEDEGKRRWREWVTTVRAIARDGRSTVSANSMYDTMYIEYHTGVKAAYLPSWCGDKTDTYWHLSHGEQPADGDMTTSYSPDPTKTTVLIGAYRTNLERDRIVTPDPDPKRRNLTPEERFEMHPIVTSLRAAAKSSHFFDFETIAKVYPKGYSNGDLATHPAIVVIPYQVSTMNLFEMYRLGIPLFFPSLDLLTSWYVNHDIMWEHQYGKPERLDDVIGDATSWPDPNDSDEKSFRFWVKWADWYVWPHIQLFDSWEDLVDKLNKLTPAHLEGISRKMKTRNDEQKVQLVANWTKIFNKIKSG